MADKGHYPLDNQILRMYAEGKKIEAEFGIYIASKENLQRFSKELPRGQFYISVGTVSKDLNISRGKAQRIIDLYKESGIIKPIFKYEKWEKKPSIWEVLSVSKSDTQSDTQNDTQNDIQKPSDSNAFNDMSDTQSDIQRNTRSDMSKKENIKRKNKNIYTSDSIEYRLAKYLYNYILKNNSKAKEPNFQTWSKTFDLMIRRDKREVEEIKELISFSQKHRFWYKNILSADSLRKQYDRLMLEMKDNQAKSNEISKLSIEDRRRATF